MLNNPCYLCLMQKQFRNIFFAKKDNIYKDFNEKVSINLTSICTNWCNILLGTVTAESWKCFLIWRLINTMLINKSHWSAVQLNLQVKINYLGKDNASFLGKNSNICWFFCDCTAACWLNTIINQINKLIKQRLCFTWIFYLPDS